LWGGLEVQAVKAHGALSEMKDSGGVKCDGIRTLPGGSELRLAGGIDERRGKEKKAGW
jgi:hypothetical protein